MTGVLRYDNVNAVDHPFYGRYATVTPGVPGRCPECDDFGYIDTADIAKGFQNQHCRACGTRWSYSFDTEGRILEVHGLPAVEPVGGRFEEVDVVIDLRTPRSVRAAVEARLKELVRK